MFRRSPLCVASLSPLKDGDVIGAHEDTVELLQRIFPKQRVLVSPVSPGDQDYRSRRWDVSWHSSVYYDRGTGVALFDEKSGVRS